MTDPAAPPAIPLSPVYGMPRSDWQYAWLDRVRPALPIVLVGLAITLILTLVVRQREERAARLTFEAAASQRFAMVNATLQRALGQLEAIGTFFDLSENVTRVQFRHLVRSSARAPLIFQAIEWAPAVNISALPELRRAARSEGIANFELRERDPRGTLRSVSPRAEYFPGLYVEPLAGNEAAVGFDLGSDTTPDQALRAARSQGRVAASARVSLTGDQGQEYGVLVFRPVFRQTLVASHASDLTSPPEPPSGMAIALPGVAADPADLRGFVVGMLRIGSITAENALPDNGPRIAVYAFDESAPTAQARMFSGNPAWQSAADLASKGAFVRRLAVGERGWTIAVIPTDAAFHPNRVASVVALIAGVLLTLLTACLQQAIAGRNLAVARQVARATAELHAEQRQLLATNQRLIVSTQHKTVFLASMSHEFRTPMNAVLGLLHVLERTQLDNIQRDYLAKIGSAGRRLLKLIDDILDVSRAEAGKLVAEHYAFALEEVLQDVLVAVAPRMQDKPVELLVDLDPALPARLLGDPSRLTQILINLVDNAAKFTLLGQITIRIQVHGRNAAQRVEIAFAVSDSGPGMSSAEAVRVFQPFVQVRSTLERSRLGGTGLGLAICRQLVNLLGGDIHVTSTPGEGSCFSFTLPFAIEHERPMLDWRAEGRSVLVLEPHWAAGQSLLRLLQAAGANACHAAQDDAAITWLQSHTVDAVLQSESFPSSVALERALANQHVSLRAILTRFGSGLIGEPVHPANEKPLLPSALAVLLGIAPTPPDADD